MVCKFWTKLWYLNDCDIYILRISWVILQHLKFKNGASYVELSFCPQFFHNLEAGFNLIIHWLDVVSF